MEFNSELMNCLYRITQEPALVIAWAAFGVPLLLILLAIPFALLRKIGIRQGESIYAFLAAVLLCNWLMGFVSQMAFMFLGVSGLKMLLLWVIMFFVYSMFVGLNYFHIKRWADKNTKSPAKK